MTLQEARDKAESESRNGYVQHVNEVHSRLTMRPVYYVVSDWYDCDRTVASFENGVQL